MLFNLCRACIGIMQQQQFGFFFKIGIVNLVIIISNNAAVYFFYTVNAIFITQHILAVYKIGVCQLFFHVNRRFVLISLHDLNRFAEKNHIAIHVDCP